jgi:gamma-glutamyltranspeptidase/glutathione hydrolase
LLDNGESVVVALEASLNSFVILMKRICCLTCCFVLSQSVAAEDVGYGKFAVATVHSEATDAAVAAYERGGNAVDAAVAAGLALGGVDGHNSGIGGGCFLVFSTGGF